MVLNYNMNPVRKNKGSAIFVHVAKRKFKSTEGCIAIQKSELLKIVKNVRLNTKIKIV
jgi:L,D-peptidoglycan transpeptidase YkuD (ErfK/YbiS/YcfS/YnhG family)